MDIYRTLFWVFTLAFVFSIVFFAKETNDNRLLKEIMIELPYEKPLIIEEGEVLVALDHIGIKAGKTKIEKVSIDKIERVLKDLVYIDKANVSMSFDGVIKLDLEQRDPILRIISDPSFYIDSHGNPMPLSKNYTSRVPILNGEINQFNFNEVKRIAQYINTNAFFKKLITSIEFKDEEYYLRIRNRNEKIKLGTLDGFEKKLFHFKTFYYSVLIEANSPSYSEINLEFNNQIVCKL